MKFPETVIFKATENQRDELEYMAEHYRVSVADICRLGLYILYESFAPTLKKDEEFYKELSRLGRRDSIEIMTGPDTKHLEPSFLSRAMNMKKLDQWIKQAESDEADPAKLLEDLQYRVWIPPEYPKRERVLELKKQFEDRLKN